MNKLIIVFSFICILFLHFLVLSYTYKKKSSQIQNQVKYSQISVHLTKLKKIEKPIKKHKKEEKKKKLIKKEVKKILHEQKKEIKKIKESTKTKNIFKKVSKEVVKRDSKKEENEQTKLLKKEKEEQKIKRVQSLQKFNQFKNTYASKIRIQIDRNKIYPHSSKRLKEEGEALVSFRVLKNGNFEKIILVKSSSKRRLDNAALNAVINTRKYKSFPKEIKKEFIDFTLLIKFKIL